MDVEFEFSVVLGNIIDRTPLFSREAFIQPFATAFWLKVTSAGKPQDAAYVLDSIPDDVRSSSD